MPVELSDEEIASLRASKEEAEKLRAERENDRKALAEANAREAAARKKYDDDMKQVASYLQQQNQPPPSDDNDDQDAIVSKKDLRRASEETVRRTAESQRQHAELLLRNQRNINKQLAVQRLGPKAEKYLAEIDAHLDKLDPAVAAQPTAYDEVFRYVRATHFDEELAEAAREREAADRDEDGDSGGEGRSEAPQRAIARTESISPSSGLTAPRPIHRSQQAKPRLTEEQRRVAAGFGMADEEYAGKWATDDEMIHNDYMGFRDKNGTMRKRV